MRITIKREDKMHGYESIPADVIIQIFDEDYDLEKELIKQVTDKKTVEFNFELSDNHECEVKCQINEYHIKEWHELNLNNNTIELEFGLKKSHKEIVDAYISKHFKEFTAESKRLTQRAKTTTPTLSQIVNENRPQATNQETTDPSRLIDRNKLNTGYVFAAVGVTIVLIAFFFGISNIESGWFKFSKAWHIFIPFAPGAALAIVGVIFVNLSGVYDKRCKECNSNRLEYSESNGKYLGTYSRQERVINRNTQRDEFARVTKSDFEHTGINTCLSCGHKESFKFRRSTSSD